MKRFREYIFSALLFALLLVVSNAQSTVLINEIRTWSGATGVDAQFPSSIELYNTGPSTENLGGWELLTNDGYLFLPSWSMPSGAYLTIILGFGTDDNNLADGEGIWYVGIDEDLGRYGGEIGLFNSVPSVGSVVDFVRWGWGGSTSGFAYGFATSANIWDNLDFVETSSYSPFSTLGRLPTGQDADTSADWGEIERQYVGNLTLDNPLQLSPRDGSLHQAMPTLHWQLVNGALDYIVELDTDSLFASVDYADTVSGTSATIAAVENYYWWRVRPRDSSEVDLPLPAAPWGFAWTTELLLADFIQYGFVQVPQLYQHKDTKMLCLWDVGCENWPPVVNAGRCQPRRCPNGCSGANAVQVYRPGCTELSGAQGPWDSAHPTTNGSTYTAADSTHIVNCRHCQQYCTRASIQMINRKYGGTLKQDEISYHIYRSDVPERDLGHQEGAWPGVNGTFSWAMNNRVVEADTAVANGPLPWATVMAEIDAGRPLLSVIQQGGHCVVTNGYLSVFNIRFVHITDPWPGNTGWYLNMPDVIQNGRNVQRNQRYSQYYRLRAAGGPITGRVLDPNILTDVDLDGVVDFDEGRFAAASAQSPRKLQCLYDQADTDGDGVGDKEEIRNYTYHRVDNPAFSRFALNSPTFSDREGDNARAENDCDADGDFDRDGEEDLNINGKSNEPGETDPLDIASVELDTFSYCDNIVGGVAIPDNGNVVRSINLPDIPQLIIDINVFVDIIHTADGDLKLELTSPMGTTVVLSNRRGSISDNYCCTWFDDEAAVAISAGSPPFAGSYIPDEALSIFDGENASGDWQLKVLDEAVNDRGRLNSWCIDLEFDEILPVNLLSFTATPLDQAVELRWKTATETQNDHFEIERDQEIVAMVESESEGQSETNYSWIDRPLQNGRLYTYTLYSIDVTGTREALTTISATPVVGGVVVTEYALHQNYPNPFNPTTTINFDLPEAANVTLAIFDIMGREIKRLIHDEAMHTGRHSIEFEAGSLPSGVYFYRLTAGEFVAQEKMLLLK